MLDGGLRISRLLKSPPPPLSELDHPNRLYEYVDTINSRTARDCCRCAATHRLLCAKTTLHQSSTFICGCYARRRGGCNLPMQRTLRNCRGCLLTPRVTINGREILIRIGRCYSKAKKALLYSRVVSWKREVARLWRTRNTIDRLMPGGQEMWKRDMLNASGIFHILLKVSPCSKYSSALRALWYDAENVLIVEGALS